MEEKKPEKIFLKMTKDDPCTKAIVGLHKRDGQFILTFWFTPFLIVWEIISKKQ